MHFSQEIGESLTYKFAQAANEMKQQGRRIISLGLGEPDFNTPQYIVDATIEAMQAGHTKYSASQGLIELRTLIAEDMSKSNGISYDASEIIITPGIKCAIYFTLCALLQPFDKIIIFSPHYVSYPSMIKLAEPTAEILIVKFDNQYQIDLNALELAFKQNPKCILLNFPHNPTGALLNEDEIKKIIELARQYGTYIVADEVYDKLVFRRHQFRSFTEYFELKDNLIVANGFSKSHAMTGWRIGYSAGPKFLIEKLNKLQQHINTNTCTFIQKGSCAIFRNKQTHLRPYVQELERRISYFDEAINNMDYIKGTKPKGGFFYFADISSTGLDSNAFCIELLKQTGIASTPGIAFGKEWDNHVRFSLAVPMETIKESIMLLQRFRY